MPDSGRSCNPQLDKNTIPSNRVEFPHIIIIIAVAPCSLLVSWKVWLFAAHKGDKSGLYCLENSSRTEKRVCMHEFGPIKSPPVSVLIIPSVHRLFRMQPLGLLHSLAFSGSAHFPIRPTVASLGREKNEREHAIDDLVGVRIDQTREEKGSSLYIAYKHVTM